MIPLQGMAKGARLQLASPEAPTKVSREVEDGGGGGGGEIRGTLAAPVPRASVKVVHLSSRMDEYSFCCPEDPCDVPSQAHGFPVCQIRGSARSLSI